VRPKPPVIVAGLFAPERRELLTLLRGLSHEAWGRPTACEGWSVKDVTAHILRDDLGNLSGGRDGHAAGHIDAPSWRDLVTLVDRANEEWVGAARPLSPRILTDLLEWSGREVAAYFATVDPLDAGENVAWAGAGPMPRWLHLAREYTERWLHQQQIRDAVAAPPLRDRRMFHPVLSTFVHALPHTYREIAAEDGAHVLLTVTGPAGGRWSLVHVDAAWGLYEDVEAAPAASVSLDEDSAWRLFTRGIDAATLDARITCRGDQALGRHLLGAVAIIASMPAGA
jgi:uncharacterized protein (TIGR03083 family)